MAGREEWRDDTIARVINLVNVQMLFVFIVEITRTIDEAVPAVIHPVSLSTINSIHKRFYLSALYRNAFPRKRRKR